MLTCVWTPTCRYNRVELNFQKNVNVQFIAAMCPPGGGRNKVTPRLLRHFHQLCINEFAPATNYSIFSKICAAWAAAALLPCDVAAKLPKLVDATLALYNAVRSNLLPTPAKIHYTFNLRDISKVFSGMKAVGVPVTSSSGVPCDDTL
jgi:dynein heavy chain, axonemal